MITLQKLNDNMLAMRCNYAYKDRCKSIPYSHFDSNLKTWVAPIQSIKYILQEFNSEIYFKTPLWKILNQPAPKPKDIDYMGKVPTVPDLRLTPYPYQADGIRFMIDRLENMGFVLNGDSVGLGKTLQATGVIKWYAENKDLHKVLIICKKSIKTQWKQEIQKITGWDELPIFVTGSTKSKRVKAYNGIRECDRGILITNYHNFLNDSELINETDYSLCIIDEAHCIKSRTSKMNKLIGATVRNKKTILLTGTPIMSRPDDIYGIVHMVSPKYFGSYREFEQRYIVTEYGIYGKQIIGAKNLDELQNKIQKFLIMRTAEEVNLQLPENRAAKRIMCEMDSTQEMMQNVIFRQKEELDAKKEELLSCVEMDESVKLEIEALNEKGKMFIAALQFVADDPAVFRLSKASKGINHQLKMLVPDKYKMSAKTEATIDAISEFIDADEKVIVFCHFASSARMLRNLLESVSGANSVMYTGAESEEQRESNLYSFKNNPETRVLIGTEAMAEGLNLQHSRNVIHYEQADTYAQRNQRIGRVRRIGSQYEYINVIDVVTENSFDEIKINKLQRDKELSESLLEKAF